MCVSKDTFLYIKYSLYVIAMINAQRDRERARAQKNHPKRKTKNEDGGGRKMWFLLQQIINESGKSCENAHRHRNTEELVWTDRSRSAILKVKFRSQTLTMCVCMRATLRPSGWVEQRIHFSACLPKQLWLFLEQCLAFDVFVCVCFYCICLYFWMSMWSLFGIGARLIIVE